MMPRAELRWPVLALSGLALAAVVLGLVAAGGPGQGRTEQRDQMRLQDLDRLSAQVNCLARETGSLPDAVAESAACPGPFRLDDPVTDAPYLYEVLAPRTYRLCAGFETDLAHMRPWNAASLDVDAGCIHHQFPEPFRPR